jgi:hypothetical protein
MHKIDLQLKLMLEGKFDEAWKISEELQSLGPQGILDPEGKPNPEMWIRHSFNRGWFLLQQNKYREGCELLENGRFINVYGSPPLRTTAPIYNPNEHSLEGKNIILSLEGGLGDELIHARFATSLKRKLKANHVYVACDPQLASIISRIDGVEKCISRMESNTVPHDFWIPGFSAGWICGYTFEDFPGNPYLTALPDMVESWKDIIKTDKKYKVGIRWAGNPKFEHQQFRRFPVNFLTQLSEYKEIQLYSLQRDNNLVNLPEEIIDLKDQINTWDDTLAAISNLDLVITSCTAVAHASAALGKETWIITPLLPYHTWALNAPYSIKTPYYESVTLFRQEQKDVWNNTFQILYKELERKFNLEHVDLPSRDKEVRRLNIGCGFKKFDDFHNVDYSEICNPDEVVDLNSKKWPWPDDEYMHIVAKDILEHLGHDGVSFTDIIKEMYRISDNGALWEIQVPHHRCEIYWDDPSHVRTITPSTIRMFDMKLNYEKILAGSSDSYLAFLNDVDIELVDVEYEYTDAWHNLIEKNKDKVEPDALRSQLEYGMNHLSNIILSTKMLVQVHKPGRYGKEDLKTEKIKFFRDELDKARAEKTVFKR